LLALSFLSEVTVTFEEPKAGFSYNTHAIDFSKNTQKEPWFVQISPNGRIPAIVDPNRNDFSVFETGAILLYLEKQ